MRFILYLLLLVSPPVLADQDADFLAAHDAFLAGDAVRLGRYAQRLKKSPLEVYASYYQLRLGLEHADPNKVKEFLSRPEDTPILDQLRVEWLKLLGKQQRWELFDADYPRLLNEDTELTCYALQSRRRSQEQAALREARKLWFSGKGQPDSCGPLFDAALSVGIISKHDVGRRLHLALEANNVSLAAKLSERLDGQYAGMAAMLNSAAADPDRYLKKLIPESAILAGVTDSKTGLTETTAAQAVPVQQSPPSDLPQSAPIAIDPAPATGWKGWGAFFSRLGLGKSDQPASATANTETLPSAGVLSASGLGAGCEAPCVDIGDDYEVPPLGWYAKLAGKGQRTVALFALERLAKQSPDLAAMRWAKIAGYFPANEQHYFYGRLAYQAARNLDSRALQWYRAAADMPLDENQSAWRVRAALRAQDWAEVLGSVNAMGENQQHDPAWRYWKARALQALGKPLEAREIFAPLSGDFHFYGQLASAELADSPVLSADIPVYKPDPQAIADMSAVPGVQRTLALYRMELRSEALEEWRWVLRNFNDRELLTAAEIARRNEMYDRAIGAADKTVNVHDFSLRYLAPYRAELQEHLLEHGLDEAWVYGLMRQESRFATSAKSEVGASGLMQIMPSTARWVAKKLGLKSYRNALIHQLDTNLRIGTYYMKSVLSRSENNPVLASAAYNAGPTRALQWRADKPLEGAIYAETIPYEETRNYVEKVMSNTMYYANQFGDPPRSLKQRLGIIAARPVDNQAANGR